MIHAGSVSARRVATTLTGIVLCLAIASVLVNVGQDIWGDAFPKVLHRLFDLNTEGNVPTWYASSTLLLCSLLLAVIGSCEHKKGRPFVRHWVFLAVVFVYLSMDEAAAMHEWTSWHIREALGVGGYLYYAWVIPASLCLLVFVIAYLRFLAALPRDTRWRFVVAGILYVGGSLGAELIGGQRADLVGEGNLVFRLVATAEEVLEMIGVVVFVHALLGYIAASAEGCGLSVRR